MVNLFLSFQNIYVFNVQGVVSSIGSHNRDGRFLSFSLFFFPFKYRVRDFLDSDN